MPSPTLPFVPSSQIRELFRLPGEWPIGMAEQADSLEHALFAEWQRQDDLPNPGRLERFDQHGQTSLSQLETLLAEWPVPAVTLAKLTPKRKEALKEAWIVDPANLRQAGEALDQRWREQDDWEYPGFMTVPSADGRILREGLGAPSYTFDTYDGQFGMWWFQMDEHPMFSPKALFNVCGGPEHMGFRAGVLSAFNSPLLSNHKNLLTLRSLVLTWWVASVDHQVRPERPWLLKMPPWHIKRNAT